MILTDWGARIDQANSQALEAAIEIPTRLSNPLLDIAEATEIFAEVELGAIAVQSLASDIEAEGAGTGYLRTAQAILCIWRVLSEGCVDRIRAISGSPPYGIDDGQGDSMH